MQGHTDRATTNERKPLTANMLSVLRSANEHGRRGSIPHRYMSQSEKNAARALLDRGLFDWDTGRESYVLTDAGCAALTAGDRDA